MPASRVSRVLRVRQATAMAANNNTYEPQDVMSAAEGVFGKGAAGLAGLIEKIFKEQGKPNAYIAGREGSAAIGLGLRYGSGTMFHKIEGQMPALITKENVPTDSPLSAEKRHALKEEIYRDIHQLQVKVQLLEEREKGKTNVRDR